MTGLDNENFVKVLNETARLCAKPRIARALKHAAQDIKLCIAALHNDPTLQNMKDLNAAFARAAAVFKIVDDLPDGDGPVGTLDEPALLQVAA